MNAKTRWECDMMSRVVLSHPFYMGHKACTFFYNCNSYDVLLPLY